MSLEDELLDPAMAAALAGEFDRYRKAVPHAQSIAAKEDSEDDTLLLSQSGFEGLLKEFTQSGLAGTRYEHRFPSNSENGPEGQTITPTGTSITDAFAWKTRQMIDELFLLVERGDQAAARSLAMISIELTSKLNRLVRQTPHLVQSLTRQLGAWPVLMSPNPNLTDKPELYYEALELGQESHWKDNRQSRFRPNDAFGRCCLHLLGRIAFARAPRSLGLPPNPDALQWEQDALLLNEFDGRTWQDWWKVANKLLKEDYVDVLEISQLSGGRQDKNRTSPGERRKDIKRRLRARFQSLANQKPNCT